MLVYYQDKFHSIKFPNDTKFFKSARKYYPKMRFRINGKLVKITDLKTTGEIRSGRENKHHIKAKSNGGQSIESNLISMDISRHNAYHLLFNNLSFKEAGELLLRVDRIKHSNKG